jgi:hypothetical protein
MASPLLPYANALLRVEAEGAVSVVNGRLITAPGPVYLFRCFLKRQQYASVSSGSVKQPLKSQLSGEALPGGSGDQFFYRGYYLQRATIASDFNWLGSLAGVVWVDVLTQDANIRPGKRAQFKLGQTPPMQAEIERSTGVFGGTGIDEILYKELGGVELQLVGAELLN